MYIKVVASIGLLIMLFFQPIVWAEECGVINLIKSKSRGSEILSNDCEDSSAMKLGSVVSMLPKARLWLMIASESGDKQQMICQNKHTQAVSVELTSLSLPWISPQGLSECSVTSKNRLVCDAEEKKNVFFCAIASVKSIVNNTNTVERATSVKMRSIFSMMNSQKDNNEYQLDLKAIKEDIRLCRKLHQNASELDISWSLDEAGEIDYLAIEVNGTASDLDKDLNECITSALSSKPGIKVNKETVYNIRF